MSKLNPTRKPIQYKRRFKDVLNVVTGRARITSPDGEDVFECYACEGPASAWPWLGGPVPEAHGIALLNEKTMVPLCEACLLCGDQDGIARRYFGNPDLKITKSGKTLSSEEFSALVESGDAVHH